MRAVYQRFCTCGFGTGKNGYSFDPDRKLWVCSTCGYPTEAWYVGSVKKGEVPPITNRKKWGTPSPVIDIQRYKVIVQRRADKARARADARLARKSTERRTLRVG